MTTPVMSRAALARCDAHTLLELLPPKSVERMSRYLHQKLGSRLLISTCFTGPRPKCDDKSILDDLAMLKESLPDGALNMTASDCDAATRQSRQISFIRQLEGKVPVFPAALTPQNDEQAAELTTEAKALGFAIGDDQAERAIGVLPPRTTEIVDASNGLVAFWAGASWSDLANCAHTAGLSLLGALSDVFATPIEAAVAGVFGKKISISHRFGGPWRAQIYLPPSDVGVIERSWAFKDIAAAEAELERVSRSYNPLWLETIPAIDAGALSSTRLWRNHSRFRSPNAAVLRVVFQGPPISRRTALMEASWGIERAGGDCHYRRAVTPSPFLDALSIASGANRIIRPASSAAPTPEGGVSVSKITSLRGNVSKHNLIWFPRDLSRSIEQTKEALGVSESSTSAATPDLPPTTPESNELHNRAIAKID